MGTVGSMEAVHAKPKEGIGMGGTILPTVFSGEEITVSGSVAAINGLVDKLEESMVDKGVLQVDKVEGKPGNYVFVNGRSVGLSNKLSDFSTLASSMSVYEQVLAKLTAKIQPPKGADQPGEVYAEPPEYQGD